MDLEFHSNKNDVNSTIAKHLPDPNQGFRNSSIVSNIFDVIENFLSNTQAPVCGSTILILLKRYPNESDISRLVSLIRSHHAIVHVMTSATPSGGSQPKTMYSVTSNTNGMGAFEYDENFSSAISRFPAFGNLSPVYATTIRVSGSGSKTLPGFYPSITADYVVEVTYQDHVLDDSFQNLTLRWTSSQDSGNFAIDSNDFLPGGTLKFTWQDFYGANYNMALDYNYSGQDVQNLQIRIYSQTPPNSWLPYNDTTCIPTDYPKTLLFAYSNDLSSRTVLDSWDTFTRFEYFSFVLFSWYGIVRFDTADINIHFHRKYGDVNSTILDSLPNPNQGFQNSSIGSNVFDAIEKFFSNTQAPVCASRIVILLKRYPNEADTTRLVSLIRSHHAIVHVVTSGTPSGGSQPKTMYSVASKTNGMGAFEYDDKFTDAIGWFPLYIFPHPVYAITLQLSGGGTKSLPDFHPSIADTYSVAINYQDHVPIDCFRNLTLYWTNPGDSGNFSIYPWNVHWINGTYIFQVFAFITVDYKMTLDYDYLGQDGQSFQIRIYSSDPLDNWLPYSD